MSISLQISDIMVLNVVVRTTYSEGFGSVASSQMFALVYAE